MPKIPKNVNINITNVAAFESSTYFLYSTSYDLNAALKNSRDSAPLNCL